MPRSPIPHHRLKPAMAAAAATALVLGAGAAALSLSPHAAAATAKPRILFDDSKAETAGNADWIIGTGIPDPLTQNPSPSKETDWTGALSSWGVALQKTGGYSLKTNAATITYGSTSNAQDLSNFDELVLPEPNVLLTAAEKTAVMKFVQNGGGLFIIVDHNGSDRNNDGSDSDKVVNDLMTNNSVDSTDPFGFGIDLKDIGNDYPKAISDSSNPVLHGPFG
ncbi:MAG: hydrolase, partial [Actinocrinis sp.]